MSIDAMKLARQYIAANADSPDEWAIVKDLDQAIEQAQKCEYPNCDYPCTDLPDCEQAQKQEPVAWKDKTYGNLHHQDFGNSIPLYTTPPQRQWVGLTDEEKQHCIYDEQGFVLDYEDCVDKTEAKLKEKNT